VRIKRRVKPGMFFWSFEATPRTLQGYEAMYMIRKGQTKGIVSVKQHSSPDCFEWLLKQRSMSQPGVLPSITFLATQPIAGSERVLRAA
jgi:hypothetical protein